MNFEEIKSIQESMATDPVVAETFTDAAIESLKIVIRTAIQAGTGLIAIEDAKNLQEEARYHLDTIISGIEWFVVLSDTYGCLTIHKPSQLDWKHLDERALLEKVDEMMKTLLAASAFSDKCRALLDLYKVELTLVGILYPS